MMNVRPLARLFCVPEDVPKSMHWTCRHLLLRSTLVLLLVGLASQRLLSVTKAQQRPDGGSVDTVTEATDAAAKDLDELRRLFVLDPESVELRVVALMNEPILARYGVSPTQGRLLEWLDEYSKRLQSQPFLRGNDSVRYTLDSLRADYLSHPHSFSSDRLAHLDHTSREAGEGPFLRGNRLLSEQLVMEHRKFLMNPSAFSQERLGELDQVSVAVSTIPFLQGNPQLVAEIERLRMRYKEALDRLPPERIAELDYISRLATGKPFVRSRWTGRWVVVALALFMAVFGLALLLKSRTAQAPTHSSSVHVEAPMSVQEACMILH
ncbi:MAG: hypothetical protein HKN13_01105, partial [Rhodothermales bacterium]|nr:hypothetical protein [Rhodothermales bacterium]